MIVSLENNKKYLFIGKEKQRTFLSARRNRLQSKSFILEQFGKQVIFSFPKLTVWGQARKFGLWQTKNTLSKLFVNQFELNAICIAFMPILQR